MAVDLRFIARFLLSAAIVGVIKFYSVYRYVAGWKYYGAEIRMSAKYRLYTWSVDRIAKSLATV